jgi:hypothetical protein
MTESWSIERKSDQKSIKEEKITILFYKKKIAIFMFLFTINKVLGIFSTLSQYFI